MSTERTSPRYSDIDVWEPSDIAEAMIEGQFTAVAAVRAARFALVGAALAAEARLRNGGRLVYVGAGTSGRLAVQDGAELIPTFSWPQDRLLLLMAVGKDEGRDGTASHPECLLVCGHDLAGPGLQRSHGRPPSRQSETCAAQRKHTHAAYRAQRRAGVRGIAEGRRQRQARR